MGCDPNSGMMRELNDESELKEHEILFKHGETLNIKGCQFKVIQICGSPHNTITLQTVGLAEKVKGLLDGMEELTHPTTKR
jgi:hypothetical protein